MAHFEEKRKFLRLNMPVEMEYVLPGANKICTAVTNDIAAGGLRFATNEQLQKDLNFEIKLKLPNVQNPVHASGRVAWLKKLTLEDSAPFDVGVEFLKIEEDNKNTFLKYLCDLIYG